MSDADNSSPKTGPNSDNPDLLAKVPDPMTADRDIAEETTDATAAARDQQVRSHRTRPARRPGPGHVDAVIPARACVFNEQTWALVRAWWGRASGLPPSLTGHPPVSYLEWPSADSLHLAVKFSYEPLGCSADSSVDLGDWSLLERPAGALGAYLPSACSSRSSSSSSPMDSSFLSPLMGSPIICAVLIAATLSKL